MGEALLLRWRSSLVFCIAVVVAISTLVVSPVQARPVDSNKSKIVELQVFPAYFNVPLPRPIIEEAVKEAVAYINTVAGPRVKVVATIRPERKLKAPGGTACRSQPRGQFPNVKKIPKREVIRVSIVQGEEWCPTEPVGGGIAQFVKSGNVLLRSIVAWPNLEARFTSTPPIRFEQGLVINNLAETLVHEIGHTLGLSHATSLACQDANGNNVPLSGKCSREEYGDVFDIMGGGLQFSALTGETLGKNRFPNLPIRSASGEVSLSANSKSTIQDRVARVYSSHGDVYFEYVPGVGVVARNYRGKFDKDFYRMGDTGLLSFGTYTDGSPRQVMVVGDSWSIPGGATVTVVSIGPDGAKLKIEPAGTTNLINDVEKPPTIRARTQDVTTSGFFLGATTEEVQKFMDLLGPPWNGPDRKVIVIEEDGTKLVNDSWRPGPSEIGIVLRNGRVLSFWRNLGSPFTANVNTVN